MSVREPEPSDEEPKAKRLKKDLNISREKSLQRWSILKAAILCGRSSTVTSNSSASVRRFSSFGLLQTNGLPFQEGDDKNEGDWFLYKSEKWPEFKMTIRHLPGIIKPETLRGFNNTGNVCVWPSEEILTYFCLQNMELFSKKEVIELGGGMTCLAGVALSIMTDIKSVVLTDGNEESVTNLDAIIDRNLKDFSDSKVSSSLFRWGTTPIEGTELKEKFDFVLCADCLFFDDGREDLVTSVYRLLKPQGEAIMFAPKRGETFDMFVSMASDRFDMEVKENYDTKVWDLHCKMKDKGMDQYDPNIHYPWHIRMKKLPETRENSSER